MEAPGPSTTSTVSASGLEAITATIEVERQEQAGDHFEDIYDIKETIEELLKGGWTRICLQFPDELLHDTVRVFQAIRSHLADTIELYVMADTTYGSCCVDEVAAQHVDAQVVVHYGHACLSTPARLPVLYVFPKAPINAEQSSIALLNEVQANADALSGKKQLLLLSDVAYYWKLDEIYTTLQGLLKSSYTLVQSRIDAKGSLQSFDTDRDTNTIAHAEYGASSGRKPGLDDQVQEPDGQGQPIHTGIPIRGMEGSSGCTCSSSSRLTPVAPSYAQAIELRTSSPSCSLSRGLSLSADSGILYIGPESLSLNNLLLSHAGVPILSYDPKFCTAKLESGRTNKMLMRRYGTVQRAKDADVFGIVVGTLGISSYLPTLDYLRKLLRKHQKKAYTVAVGKLTPAKLGNFLEIECWVLVACTENSLVEAHKEFLRPIITPWELEVALGEKQWMPAEKVGGYTLDFGKVLRDSEKKADSKVAEQDETFSALEGGANDPEGPVFSTVTGTYRYKRTYGDKSGMKDVVDLAQQVSALAVRNNQNALATILSSAAGEHLSTRTYQGLEPRYDLDAPAMLEIGRSGVAREYTGDTEAASASTVKAAHDR